MFDIVVAVNNDEVLAKNLLRSPLVGKEGVTLRQQKGCRSAGLAYNAGLSQCVHDLVICVHQDVYIPAGWDNVVGRSIAYLDRVDPEWAVLGVYGVGGSKNQVGYVWSSGLNKLYGGEFDLPAPVVSIDELLIILRRSSGLIFDNQLPGFHLYGTDIVQAALNRKKTAYVICAPVVHNSFPSLYLGADYFAAHRYLMRKWKANLPIVTCVAPIEHSYTSYLKLRLRHWVNELRYRNVSRLELDRCHDPIDITRQLKFE